MSGKKIKAKGSPLNELNAKILELIIGGQTVIRLNVGEPHVTTPLFLIEAGAEASKMESNNGYTFVEGAIEIRESISEFVYKMFTLEYSLDEIIFTSGAKQGIDLAVAATLADQETKPGYEIIIFASDWPTYNAIIRAHDGILVLVGPNEDFSLPLAEIRAKITKNTRAIIINSPNNPTSVIWSNEELGELAQLAIEHDFIVISDEVYNTIILEGEMPVSIASFKGMKERTIIVNSFSKMWAIPGWRAGFVLAINAKCRDMIAAKSNIDGNSCSLLQFIIKAAIDNHFEDSLAFIKKSNEEYKKNKDYICAFFDLWGIEYVPPKGAFYVFVKLPKKFGVNSEECSEILLQEGLAVAPGIIFGETCDDYIRICFATTTEELIKAMNIIEKLFIQKGVVKIE
ncbi:MAG: pyridoxal phosphate-dependent aminotransferase [Candidatus Pacebacteria bacterium]|nr:pyridoxal phosphate-dependent aminotransferase [Candidatus Paceibacterota bacterium]